MMTADPIPSIRDYRLSLGISLETLAGHLGTTQARISALEAGKEIPTDDEAATLADLFALAPAELRRTLAVTARKPRRPRGGIVEMQEGNPKR